MTCPECRERLQQWLDGRTRDAAPGEPPALCPVCADWAAAARRLDRGLRLLTPPTPPPHLVERIVAGVSARHRVRRRRVLLWAAAATAAALLIVAAARIFHAGVPPSSPMAQGPGPTPAAPTPAEGHATLRESMEEAGSAVASLTSRTADETVANTKLLIPVLVDPSLGKIDLQPSIDPPTRSLREAGAGVSAGLEPVADSARRAVGLFLRELPPMDAAPKGGF